MCVIQNEQRLGVGSELLKKLVIELIPYKVRHLSLLTDKGTFAEKFYEKSGFHLIKRLVFYSKNI